MSTQTHLAIADSATVKRHVWALLRKRLSRLAWTTALFVLGSSAALAIPVLLGRIVDAVIDQRSSGTLTTTSIWLVIAGITSSLMLMWAGRLLVSVLQNALAELRESVFGSALRLDQGTVESAGTADVVSRVTGDVEAITDAVSGVLPRFVYSGFTIVLTAVGLATLDPWLAAAALLAVPIQVASVMVFLRRSRPLYRALRQQESERGQSIIETVRGGDTVTALGQQDVHLSRVADRSLAAVNTSRAAGRARNRFNAGLNTAEFVGLAAILAVGFWRSSSYGLTVGAVTAAALLFHRLFGPIGALLSSLDDLQRASAGLGRLVGVFIAVPAPSALVEIRDRDIQIAGVRYRYQDDAPEALRGIDLHLAPLSVTMLVGVSGSGKSTLAQLVAGVFAPLEGSVRIGRVDAMVAGRGSRPAVHLVTQDTHLFMGTLADNLRLAEPNAGDDELWHALDTVGAAWARQLPEGLESELAHELDEQCVQQLALARVLIADSPVVVLDEATAHGNTQGTLEDALREVCHGRTVVIVAHSFAQASLAHRIIVLDEGRIIEDGTHAHLVGKPDGTYSRLYRASLTE